MILEEEVLHSVEVAQPFFAYVASDDEIALKFQAGIPDGPHDAEHLGKRRSVIADAGAVVYAVLLGDSQGSVHGEDGVDVSGHVYRRSVGIGALEGIVDVVHGVPAGLEAFRFEHLLIVEGSLFLKP